MRICRIRWLCCAGLLALVLASVCHAQIPRTIYLSGTLTDIQGRVVPDGTYNVRFAIFDAPTGGNRYWTAVQSTTQFDGYFSTILGLVAPINIPFDRQYWVAVKTGTDYSPIRIMLSHTGYAINSALLNGYAPVTTPQPYGILVLDVNGQFWGSVIAAESIVGAQIKDGTIASADLANGAVTGSKLAAGSVSKSKLNFGPSVESPEAQWPIDATRVGGFQAAAVPTANMLLPLGATLQFPLSVIPQGLGSGLNADLLDGLQAADFFPSDHVMTTENLAAGAVTTDKIATGAVTLDKLDPTITLGNATSVDGFSASGTPTPGYLLALDAMGKYPLSVIPQGAGSGLSADLLDGRHADALLRIDSIINGDMLAQGSISTNKIADGAVTQEKLAPGIAIPNADTVDGLHAHLGPVAGGLLALGEDCRFPLTVIPMGSGSGLDADMLDGLQSSDFMLADTTITSSMLGAGAVTTAKIANGAVTQAKLDPSLTIPNADAVDNFNASTVPMPGWLLTLGANGRYPLGVIPQGHASGLNADLLDGWQSSDFLRTGSLITSDMLASGSVVTSTIANGAVTQDKLDPSISIPSADAVDGFDASATPAANQLLPLNADARFPLEVVPQGPGSVLNADLLDGREASDFLRTGSLITTDMLAANAVTTPKIADGAITQAKLDSAIVIPNADKLDGIHASVNPIAGYLLALRSDGRFPLSTIPMGTGSGLDADKFDGIESTMFLRTDSTIPGSMIADGAITAPKIADGAITTAKLDPAISIPNADRVDGFHASASPLAGYLIALDANARLAIGAIPQGPGSTLNADLLDGLQAIDFLRTNATITTPMIADGAITTAKLDPAISIPNADKVDGYHASAIPLAGYLLTLDASGKLAIGAIPQGPGSTLNTDLLDGLQAIDFLRSNATITSAMIADNAITTTKIANGAITQAKLDPGIAIPNADKLDNLDSTDFLRSNATITTAMLADGAVTQAKLDPAITILSADKVDGLHASLSPIAGTLLALDAAARFPASIIPQGPGSGFDADLLDGFQATDFMRAGTPISTDMLTNGAVTTAKIANGAVTQAKLDPAITIPNADKVDGLHASDTPIGGYLLTLGVSGKFPMSTIPQGSGSGLNADLLDGYSVEQLLNGGAADADKVDGFHASATAEPNTLLALDGDGLLPADAIRQGPDSGLNADLLDGYNADQLMNGGSPNADTVDSLHASATPTANYLFPLGADGKYSLTVIPQGTGSGLNADLLDGLTSLDFSRTGHTHPGTEITSAVETAMNALKLNGFRASDVPTAGYLLPLGTNGKFPLSVIPQGPGSGLNADLLGGYTAAQLLAGIGANTDTVDTIHASITATAGLLFPLGEDTKFPLAVLPQGSGSGMNADLLDGKQATEFAATTHTHAGSEITSAVGDATRADLVDGLNASATPTPYYMLALDAEAKFPNSAIRQGAGSGLDADKLRGYTADELIARFTQSDTVDTFHASATPTANNLLPLGTDSKFPLSVILQGPGSGLNADMTDGYHADPNGGAGTIPVLDGSGKMKLATIPQGAGSGLNADKVDGLDASEIGAAADVDKVDHFNASATATANTLLALDAIGRFPNSVLYTGHGGGLIADAVDTYHAAGTPTAGFLLPLGTDSKFPLSVILHGPGSGLDADTLDGTHLADIQANSDKVDQIHAATTPTANYLFPLGADSKFPLTVIPQGTGSGLNADKLDGLDASEIGAAADVDKVDGFNASLTPTASTLLPLDANMKLPASVIPQGEGSTFSADLIDGLHAWQIASAADVDKVDHFDASANPIANALLALDANKKFPMSVLPATAQPTANSLLILDANARVPLAAVPQGTGSGLDADRLDGKQATEFALTGHTHSGSEITGPIARSLNSDALGGALPTNNPAPNKILVLDDLGKFPAASIHQGDGSTLNSDMVDGFHAWELMANETPDHSNLVWLDPTEPQVDAALKLYGTDTVLTVQNTTPPPSWTNAAPSAAPAARYLHSMAHDPINGVTLLYGGRAGGSTFYSDTWLYSGMANTWTHLTPTSCPGPLYGSAMVYNKRANLYVLFGGHNGTTWKGETWVFDPANGQWSLRSPGVSPDPRSRHAMVYDEDTGMVVLCGGGNASGMLNDTWVYDTAADSWFRAISNENPAPRHLHAMVYDPKVRRTLLFGGYANPGGAVQDMWAFDAGALQWSALTTTGAPSKRYEHKMVYDARTEKVVLYGGYSTTYIDETWSYDSTSLAWKKLDIEGSPGGRQGTAMVFDSATKQMLLFGGYNGAYLADTWRLSLGGGLGIYCKGDVYIEGNEYAETRTGGAIDLAEYVRMSEPLEPGDVVVIDPDHDSSLIRCTAAFDTSVAGVISTKPSYLMGANPVTGNAGDAKLALAGRVPCKVDARFGAIRRGDLLVASPTPGHAMRADNPPAGSVIGKAMQPLGEGVGVIEVLIGPR